MTDLKSLWTDVLAPTMRFYICFVRRRMQALVLQSQHASADLNHRLNENFGSFARAVENQWTLTSFT
jgi:hypothetical protein